MTANHELNAQRISENNLILSAATAGVLLRMICSFNAGSYRLSTAYPVILDHASRQLSLGSYAKKPRFYFPELGKASSKGMEFWRLIMMVRNRDSARALTTEDKTVFYRDIKMSLEKVLSHILRIAMPVTSPMQLAQLAARSGGDVSTCVQIYKAFQEVGIHGMKMVMENLEGEEDELDVESGLLLKLIRVHPLFIESPNGTNVLGNCNILLCGGQPTPDDLMPYLQLETGRRPLVFIFETISPSTLYFLIQKRLRDKLEIAAVELNKYIKCPLSLDDIAIMTSGRVIQFGSESSQPDESAFANVGSAFIQQKYVLFLKITENTSSKTQALDEIKKAYNLGLPGSEEVKERLQAMEFSKIAIIKSGGDTDLRRTQRMGAAADALQKAQGAVEYGLLPAAGRDLVEMLKVLDQKHYHFEADGAQNSSTRSGVTVVTDAIRILYQEMGRRWPNNIETDKEIERVKNVPLFYTYDPERGQYINLIESGQIDNCREIIMSLRYALDRSALYEQRIFISREDKKYFALFEEDVDPVD